MNNLAFSCEFQDESGDPETLFLDFTTEGLAPLVGDRIDFLSWWTEVVGRTYNWTADGWLVELKPVWGMTTARAKELGWKVVPSWEEEE